VFLLEHHKPTVTNISNIKTSTKEIKNDGVHYFHNVVKDLKQALESTDIRSPTKKKPI
jgi:hypothetical protein